MSFLIGYENRPTLVNTLAKKDLLSAHKTAPLTIAQLQYPQIYIFTIYGKCPNATELTKTQSQMIVRNCTVSAYWWTPDEHLATLIILTITMIQAGLIRFSVVKIAVERMRSFCEVNPNIINVLLFEFSVETPFEVVLRRTCSSK